MPAKRRRIRRNVQQGFWDATGFHPIRASADYDSGRLFDDTEEGSYRRKKKKSKAKGKRRKNASTRSGLAADPRGWMSAKAVRIVKRGGRAVLQIKK